MEHINFTSTPISRFYIHPQIYESGEIIFKRDDLFYHAGGGSKARMLQYIITPNNTINVEVIVTAGGPLSNFNRACALHCASLGLKMHLICYTDNDEEFDNSMNYFLVKLSNVTITRCKKSSVPETIQEVMSYYRKKNIKAKNIYGGGRCIEGIYSYYDAVKELYNQIGQKWSPSKFFVACGTGTTTSGISAGLQDFFPNAQLHAISVARKAEDELPIIYENIETLNRYFGKNKFNGTNIYFHDEYILGGYGNTTEELNLMIRNFISKTGILLDPIYSGKAYYGMKKMLESETKQTVVFWHTGALYTLLSERHLINV